MAEKRSKRLDSVRDLAQFKEQKALESFGQSSQYLDQQQQQLTKLYHYRSGYQQNLQSEGEQIGITVAKYRQVILFMGRLDEAIVQQTDTVAIATQVREQKRQLWLEAHRRTQALAKVKELHEAEEAYFDHRQEQKVMDEMAQQRRIL